MAREDTEAFDIEHDRGARRRRTIVTFLVVALLLFFAFWYAMSYIRADDARRVTPKATPSSCAVAPADITVNVYNGTTREGLAAKVTGALRKRGFVIGKVGNEPEGGKVAGAGQLRYGAQATEQVRIVARHVGQMEQLPDQREDPVVDVVLGKDFAQLVPLATARGC
ncbi:LytR C-terminal domain-containing protein [Janibacter sp. YIM B02568]|uniref:LytR C-terminal domain-containing protein n=1 Tax=Janibacter endophyticus TaxID=2806261 RepID=UPI00194EEFDA|nr:LytR C-terminal domain-containing protein [Janibacter endophyticus]MBM6544604.1 LytR C-terminal domain-containing protein [Janibacter endophyticus]